VAYNGCVWRVAVAMIAGCGFQPAAVTGADSAVQDADPRPSCAATAALPGTVTNPLGASGTNNGNLQPDLDCAAGELPIGIGFESTMNNRAEGGDERVITAIHVQCGSIAIHSDGKVDLAPAEAIGWTAGMCPGWPPYVTAPIVRCPDNTVLVGLTANGGSGTLFNSAALTCRMLLAGGALGVVVPPTAVVDTGNDGNNPQSAQCAANAVLVSFALRGNCGLDQLTPRCSPLQCN
jgi:hypothetical protein